VQNKATNKGNKDEDRYLSNPLPQNEHVGVDEEVMYLGKEPIEATNMALTVHQEPDKEKDDSEDDDEAEDEAEDENGLEIESGADLQDGEELV
jgi:hypothetical protein